MNNLTIDPVILDERRYQAHLEQNEQIEAMAEAEAKSYFDEAERRQQTDWSKWNEDDNADALVALWHVLTLNETAQEKVALSKEIIRGLMVNAANGHATRVMERRR